MKRMLFLCLGIFLAGCGQQRPTAEWVDQLQAGDAAAKLEAIGVLAKCNEAHEQTVPALAEALKDGNAFVRRDAARALGKLGQEAAPAARSLSQALRDKERSVRRAAADALKRIQLALGTPTGTSRP